MIDDPSKVPHSNCYICNKEKYNKYDYCLNCWRKIEIEADELSNSDDNENDILRKINEIEEKFENDILDFQIEALEEYAKNELIKLIAYYKILEDNFDCEYTNITIDEYQKQILQLSEKIKNGYEENSELNDFRKKYPAEFHCEDGHYVRSPYEQQIDDYLNERKIRHYYEKRYKNFKTGECYYPDWFLPDLTKKGVYIECFGKQDTDYKTKTEKKLEFYKQENIDLIEIYPENIKNLKEFLDDQINTRMKRR